MLNESGEKLCNCDGNEKFKMFGERGVAGHRKPLCGAEGCVFTGMEHSVVFGVRCAGNVCWDAGSGVGI
jgi:hypothetical protein